MSASEINTALLAALAALIIWAIRVSYNVGAKLLEFEIRYMGDHVTRAEHDRLLLQVQRLAEQQAALRQRLGLPPPGVDAK